MQILACYVVLFWLALILFFWITTLTTQISSDRAGLCPQNECAKLVSCVHLKSSLKRKEMSDFGSFYT